MYDTTRKISTRMGYAMQHRPKVPGFPYLAECLRRAGVERNTWALPGVQSMYVMHHAIVVQQGTPLVSGTVTIPSFNQKSLIIALRTDQAGQSTFPEFLLACWNAGVVGYEVDFSLRTVSYYGARNECYKESYQEVSVGQINF